MTGDVRNVIQKYADNIRAIFGTHLKNIILYGSYARGDYTQDSDVDLMVLVNLSDPEIEQYSDQVAQLGFDYNVEYGLWFMPEIKNVDHFNIWSGNYPFYANVKREGVNLYAA